MFGLLRASLRMLVGGLVSQGLEDSKVVLGRLVYSLGRKSFMVSGVVIFLICGFGCYLMRGNADPTWGCAPMVGDADWCGFFIFESTILMDTLALVVVRMGSERCFASLLRICRPVDDVDCCEGYAWCAGIVIF